MPTTKTLIVALKEHALAKKGAVLSRYSYDPNEPEIAIASRLSWPNFLEVSSDGVLRLPVYPKRLAELRKQFKAIKKSDSSERDGHAYADILAADVPLDTLKSLVDEAYQLIWDKLQYSDRLMHDLAAQPYDEAKILDALIDCHKMEDQRGAIHKLLRPAIVIRTSKSSDAKLPLGATKIGGAPDLSPDVAWPCYKNGRLLAFLAQFDLAEIAKQGDVMKGLPEQGLLSLFSAWGWVTEEGVDADLPGCDHEQNGWTVVLHTPFGARKERRKAPRGMHSFIAVAAEPIRVMSLPSDKREPVVVNLGWSEKVLEQFDFLQQDYRAMQMRHFLNHYDISSGCHQLGGYGLYQQQFPGELADSKLVMFAQIASDNNTDMCWGDGGELTFCVDAEALANGRVEPVWGTSQGG
jgi:uncharacterized protein YwqG